MPEYNTAEARSKLSQLLQKAMRGEDVIIARNNKPVGRLVAVAGITRPRKPGTARGGVRMSADFDAIPRDFDDYR